jgi:hypothetical protein
MNMRPIYRILICAVFIVSCVRAQTKPATIEIYTNEKLGFKIQYLSIWKVSEWPKPWIVVHFAPPEGSESHSQAAIAMPQLTDRPAGEPIKLDEIDNALVNEMKTDMPDAKVVISSPTTLDGEPALRMILTGHDPKTNLDMKLLVIGAAHKDKAYVVGVMATADEWSRAMHSFDHLIETFAFIEKQQ